MNFRAQKLLKPKIRFYRYGFAHIGRVGSVFMTLSVTLERFFAIVYPLKRLRLKTILIGASTILSVVYNIPRFLEFETILVVDTNSTNNASVSISLMYTVFHKQSFNVNAF